MTHRPRPLGFVAVVLFLAGCGGAAASTSTSPSPAASAAPSYAPGDVTVKVISDPATIGAFTPQGVSARAGQVVEWDFEDLNPHTVTSDDGLFTSRASDKGKKYSRRFDKAGTFKYHCYIHPEMLGTVTVS
jgi:plastocyanin